MTDRPILFSAPMIRALLAGRKTQTRRVIKLPTKGEYVRPDMGGWESTTNGGDGVFTIARDGAHVPVPRTVGIWNRTTGTCLDARYQPGDRLWVRETCRGEELPSGQDGVRFRADDLFAPIESTQAAAMRWLELHTYRGHEGDRTGPWVPPIHAPRWASRLTLIVDDVKVEQLQVIGEADALAEGIREMEPRSLDGMRHFGFDGDSGAHPPTARRAFQLLWTHINGADAWAANPWVAAITFQVVHANIDKVPA